MSVQRQNPDGSWSDAEPMGWQGPVNQVDWEVYWKPISRTWHAYGYCRGKFLVDITARTKVGLRFKAWRAFRLRPQTFLWDSKESDR